MLRMEWSGGGKLLGQEEKLFIIIELKLYINKK